MSFEKPPKNEDEKVVPFERLQELRLQKKQEGRNNDIQKLEDMISRLNPQIKPQVKAKGILEQAGGAARNDNNEKLSVSEEIIKDQERMRFVITRLENSHEFSEKLTEQALDLKEELEDIIERYNSWGGETLGEEYQMILDELVRQLQQYAKRVTEV